ncbi:MAG: DinB family protein [Flavobacteriales bacterium]|nr:DinB family protein [Flavobacteriales bacterium]
MRPAPWHTRSLPNGLGMEQLPVLLARVRGTPVRMQEVLRSVRPEQLALHRSGEWGVLEHLAHLTHLQDRLMARVDDLEARRPDLCPIDLADQVSVLTHVHTRHPGDVLEEFRLRRLAFVQRVQRMPDAVLAHVARHPCGERPTRVIDMLLWVAEHDDHHLAHIHHLLGAGR